MGWRGTPACRAAGWEGEDSRPKFLLLHAIYRLEREEGSWLIATYTEARPKEAYQRQQLDIMFGTREMRWERKRAVGSNGIGAWRGDRLGAGRLHRFDRLGDLREECEERNVAQGYR
jgi:hypothetical protein